MTAKIMMRTGLNEQKLTELLLRFCGKRCAASVLGGIFAAQISITRTSKES